MYKIEKWSTIEAELIKNRNKATLILGNGSSIAFSDKFSYKKLFDKAVLENLIGSAVELFNHLKTTDFEYILRVLYHAEVSNRALEAGVDVFECEYNKVRDGLVSSVRANHCTYGSIEMHADCAASFVKKFSTVISLNYDLILYWISQKSNSNRPLGVEIKNCFVGSDFDLNWGKYALPSPKTSCKNSTLIFWPHGNLVLARNKSGRELKLSYPNGTPLKTRQTKLLDHIIESWSKSTDPHTPIFVSEGTSEHKLASIRRSIYLSTVLHEVIPSLEGTIVSYGWSWGSQDEHILNQIMKSKIKKIAISIYKLAENEHDCLSIESQIRKAESGKKYKPKNPIDVVFFDSADPGAWIS